MSAATKILFVSHSDDLQGGSQGSLLELIKSAKERGYTPFLVVPKLGELSRQAEVLGVKCLATTFYRWGLAGSEADKITDIESAINIANFIKKEKIESVVTNTLMVPWGALAAAIANVPHVWVAREFFAHHREYLKGHYEFVKAYSNLVMANSKSNAAYLRDKAGIKNAKHFYSYVDVKNIKLGKGSTKPRIVSIGIIHPDKNQFELLKAVAELKKQKYDIPGIHLFGRYREDDYFKKLNDFIKGNNLEETVTFQGFVEKPYEKIGPDDILVQPSKHESLGRTITEAMKLGLICVGADVEGTKEAISLGGGTLYKSGSPQDLAKKLSDIIKNHQDYLLDAKRAQEKALSNLSEKASNQPFFDELKKVLGQANPRSELVYLLPHLEGLTKTKIEERIETLEQKMEEYRQAAARRRKELDSILNSRTWKAMVMAGKVKSLPKTIINSRNLIPGLRKAKAIHFIYLDKKKLYGSTVMRGDQLSAIAKKALPNEKILYSPLSFNYRDSILFITKWALAAVRPTDLERLKSGGNILIFDPVDAALPPFTEQYADILVAASKTAFRDYKKQLPNKKVMLVNHHVDPRIRLDETKKPKKLKTAYFGERVNAYITPAIEKIVDVIQVSTNKQENDWLDRLSNYNLHYAVRQIEQSDNHKPFLKGFTAAYCGANIIIQDSQEEALLWLGKDYPYLIKGEVTEKKVLQKLEHVKDSFGSTEWKKALKMMNNVKEQTSSEAIGKQLIDLFSEARS